MSEKMSFGQIESWLMEQDATSVNEEDRPWDKPIPAILIQADKGGTGKSSVALNLLRRLKNTGLKIGFVDADIDSPNVPDMLGLKGPMTIDTRDRMMFPIVKDGVEFSSSGLLRDGLFVTSNNGKANQQIVTTLIRGMNWKDRELLIVDCPAGSGDELLSVVNNIGSENIIGSVVVVTPVNQSDLRRVFELSMRQQLRLLGVIENMKGVHMSCCGTLARCPTCSHTFEPFKVPPGVPTVQDVCKELVVPYFGSIPLVDGYAESVMLKSPQYPEAVMAPIEAVADVVQKVLTVMLEDNAGSGRNYKIARVLLKVMGVI